MLIQVDLTVLSAAGIKFFSSIQYNRVRYEDNIHNDMMLLQVKEALSKVMITKYTGIIMMDLLPNQILEYAPYERRAVRHYIKVRFFKDNVASPVKSSRVRVCSHTYQATTLNELQQQSLQKVCFVQNMTAD